MQKQTFFRAAMAGLGKYHMGGYGRIGVYSVNNDTKGTVSQNSYLSPCFHFMKSKKICLKN